MPPDRFNLIRECMSEIHSRRYRYDLAKGGTNWNQIPPPAGTGLNCRAVAHLLTKMAEKRGVQGLTVVSTHIKDGFFLLAPVGKHAFGTTPPPVNSATLKGWEFEHHYRVKDTVTGKVYDPTFSTSGEQNPTGIKCTASQSQGLVMTSIYGGRYKVTRSHVYAVEELHQRPIAAEHIVKDTAYT